MTYRTKTVFMALLLALISITSYADSIYPADGDAWTEDSTTGWTGGTPAQSTDHMVGDYSITNTGLVSNYPSFVYQNASAIDLSNPNSILHFFCKINFTGTHTFSGEVRVYSEGAGVADFIRLRNAFPATTGTLDWTEFEITLSSMETIGAGCDLTKVNKFTILPYNPVSGAPYMGDGTTTIYVDGLYFAVPEPATMAIVVAGSIVGLIRRRR